MAKNWFNSSPKIFVVSDRVANNFLKPVGIICGRNEIPLDIYKNLSDINF